MVRHTSATSSAPVRKIGVKNRSVSGIVPKMGHYESTLERDFMELIRFEGGVESFVAQPLKIRFRGEQGGTRTYTPDGLIHFKNAKHRKSLLYEVKHRDDFRTGWRTLMPGFRAAKKYCEGRNWEFRVFTEKEIRTPFLTNVKFLWPFKETKVDSEISGFLLSRLSSSGAISVEDLLKTTEGLVNRTHALQPLWSLIADGSILCDLEELLTPHSLLWLGEG